MSQEKEPQSPETLSQTAAELEALAHRSENLTPENSETARAEQLEQARTKIEQQVEEPPAQEEAPKPKPPVTRFDKAAAYRDTMRSLQRQLKPASRSFSRVIHHPIVDKASEVVGQTVLRPSVTLGATLTPLIIGSFVFLVAKRYGFALRGSELLLLLLFGGLLGLLIELITKLFRRRRP